MQNKAVSRMSKVIIIGQLVVVLGFFSFVYLFVPHIDYPKDGAVVQQKDIEFKFRNANVILIDENEDFSSPKKINLDEMNVSKILFEPGTYYWKAIGVLESQINKFTISSLVGLELNEENSSLKNVGNVGLNVSVEDQAGVSGLVILDVDVEYFVEDKDGNIYRGEQYEK